MGEITDQSVHLIVTSPPYWQLKDYGHPGQTGFDDTYEDYINNLNLVWMECRRVLHPGCRLCINIGDQFARSVYYGRYKVIPIRTEIIRFCETIGFDYMGAIIWQKVTTCNTTGGGTVMGSFPYPRNGVVKIDYEFILLFRKHGEPPKVPKSVKETARLSTEEWNTYFNGHWNFPGDKQGAQLAAFPLELPRRLIRMFSFPGETVLDPFAGSGTTMLAAAQLERGSIGYEINPELEAVVRNRLEGVPLRILKPGPGRFDRNDALKRLPYRFRDPLPMAADRQQRAKTFGSKINSSTPPRETYYRVSRVLGPAEIELDDGTLVRLLGIEAQPTHSAAAVALLRELLDGQRVYLRQDMHHPGENGRRAVYLYLANRAFVNARLVRSGLVRLDESQSLEKMPVLKRAANHGG